MVQQWNSAYVVDIKVQNGGTVTIIDINVHVVLSGRNIEIRVNYICVL